MNSSPLSCVAALKHGGCSRLHFRGCKSPGPMIHLGSGTYARCPAAVREVLDTGSSDAGLPDRQLGIQGYE